MRANRIRTLVAALALAAAAFAGATTAQADNGTSVTVMTQNLYFGARRPASSGSGSWTCG